MPVQSAVEELIIAHEAAVRANVDEAAAVPRGRRLTEATLRALMKQCLSVEMDTAPLHERLLDLVRDERARARLEKHLRASHKCVRCPSLLVVQHVLVWPLEFWRRLGPAYIFFESTELPYALETVKQCFTLSLLRYRGQF